MRKKQQKTIITLMNELETFEDNIKALPPQNIRVIDENDNMEKTMPIATYMETLTDPMLKSFNDLSQSTLNFSSVISMSDEQRRAMETAIDEAAALSLPSDSD